MAQVNEADTVRRATTITTIRSFCVATIAAAWLSSGAPAMAGSGGGADLGHSQSLLDAVCKDVGISISLCPKLPTINQLVVENAALNGITPATVRQLQGLPAGAAVDAGSERGLKNPLAFISPSNNLGQPIPTNSADAAANSFLTAATAPTNGSPSTLDLTFDYHLRTLGFIGQQGNLVGQIMLPLITNQMAISDSNPTIPTLSNPPLATLQIFADPNTCPTCVTTDIVASLTGASVTYQLSQLGMTFSNDNSHPGSMNFSPNEQFTVEFRFLSPPISSQLTCFRRLAISSPTAYSMG